MKSATGIVPEELMEPGKVDDVVNFLVAYPLDGAEKQNILVAWSKAVGANLGAGQLRRVRES